MTAFPLTAALTAGALAALNPCGFVLLPGYLGLYASSQQQVGEATSPTRSVRRALAAAACMTLGFLIVFTAFGLAAAPAAVLLSTLLPWFTVALGVLLAFAGVWLLAGRHLSIRLPTKVVRIDGASLKTAIGYGIAYALASLSCAAAPFLALVISTFRFDSVWQGVVAFSVYAMGMGLVVGAVSVLVVLARDGWLRRTRRGFGVVVRMGATLLVLVGAYVAWYGWYEIRLNSGHSAADPIIAGAEHVQGWLSSQVSRSTSTAWPALMLVLALLGFVVLRHARRRRMASRRRP